MSAVKVVPESQADITIDATVTSKGQITLPRVIRKRLMAKAGDKVTFKADATGIKIARTRPSRNCVSRRSNS